MISLYVILTVARYEAKVLFRSWFFRIFSILALVIIVLLDVSLFALPMSSRWIFYGLSSSIPYLNLLLLNVAQAIIGVFMASDFLKFDRKLDTTEVIYMRSMTNADYVLGKMLGVLAIFGMLNILVLVIALVFNIFFTDVPVTAAAYFFYPLLISLPTLIFIFGLTFLVMVTLKSQAVTFIILLGYIAGTLFFLSQKFHYLFDYMTFNVPLMYSDFVGFGNLTPVLTHRGIYFLLGVASVSITILFLKRLPQSRIMNKVSLIIAILSVCGALFLGHAYIADIEQCKALREKMAALNKESSAVPKVSIDTCSISLSHENKEIEVEAHLLFTNKTNRTIERYLFSLNPGLAVKKIERNGKDIPFTRNLHLFYVKPPEHLQPGAADSLTVFYKGGIDDEACYLDIDDKTREAGYRLTFYNISKRAGFITPDYVLLTPETLWYPRAGIPEGAAYPQMGSTDFIKFTLQVKTHPGLKAVSQGAVTEKEGGEFLFRPELLLPRLSLAIGKYESRSVTIDSVDYSIYFLKGHDFFSKFFNEAQDTLPGLIRRARRDFENDIGLNYPYHRLSLVETPIQFYAYSRIWTQGRETSQPEQIFMPEKGLLLPVDFKLMNYWMSRRSHGGQNQMTPLEVQMNLFQRFFNSVIREGDLPFRNMRAFRQSQAGSFSLQNLVISIMDTENGDYSVFPLFYSHIHHFTSEKWPIFNTAMEFYLRNRLVTPRPMFGRFFWGPSAAELANFDLMKQSLAEILADPKSKDKERMQDILRNKCISLFALLENKLGKETLANFLKDYFNSHEFIDIPVGDFLAELKNRFGLELEPHFESWLEEKKLPGFIVTDLDSYEILDQERTRYQVVFKVANPETVDGLIEVKFRTERTFREGPGFDRGDNDQQNTRLIYIPASQKKEIGIVLDKMPTQMTISTFISQNLPSVIERQFGKMEARKKEKPFEGEKVLNEQLVPASPGTIVVDNEDRGFEVRMAAAEGYLKKLLSPSNGNDGEFIGIWLWNLPKRWRATTYNDFYGTYRHSAYYIKSGDGGNRVSWKAELPESGRYDVYNYVTNIQSPWMHGHGHGDDDALVKDLNFTIRHDDGVEEVKLDNDGVQAGWNLLNTYYFSKGPAVVELSDKSKGRIVYADAVKWVEHK